MSDEVLDYYATPGRFTRLDEMGLPTRVEPIIDMVRGLLVYDVVAEPFYGAALSDMQANTIHQRDSAELLATIRTIDDRPLTEARPPSKRVGARCHIYSRMTVSFLRAAGIPARARCGFGTYFRPGWLEDHWVAEYWNAAESRWQMVEAQLDEVWRDTLGYGGDPLHITAEEFVTAGHAWQAWRDGSLDERRCGLSAIEEHGAHWIANNLRLDLASLNKVEMLPWDAWGAGWEPGDSPTAADLELFDQVAALTVLPDESFGSLRTLYETTDGLRAPDAVFNVLRDRMEPVAADGGA